MVLLLFFFFRWWSFKTPWMISQIGWTLSRRKISSSAPRTQCSASTSRTWCRPARCSKPSAAAAVARPPSPTTRSRVRAQAPPPPAPPRCLPRSAAPTWAPWSGARPRCGARWRRRRPHRRQRRSTHPAHSPHLLRRLHRHQSQRALNRSTPPQSSEDSRSV